MREPICTLCNGEQVTDNNEEERERAPWSWWQALTPPADIAVRLGIVKPIPCSRCTEERT